MYFNVCGKNAKEKRDGEPGYLGVTRTGVDRMKTRDRVPRKSRELFERAAAERAVSVGMRAGESSVTRDLGDHNTRHTHYMRPW